MSLVEMLKEHHLVVRFPQKSKRGGRGRMGITTQWKKNAMDEQTCPYCNQPVKAEQVKTISENGQLAHAECSAKAGGEAIVVPGAEQIS